MPSIAPIAHDCSLVKLGGSLLEIPELQERLTTQLQRVARWPILLVGGGRMADVVRQWDEVHHLSALDSDELARQTLIVTAEFITRLLPNAHLVENVHAAIDVLREGGWPVVDAPSVLNNSVFERLPRGWHVTSDSIAAAIAVTWSLRELILVKSVPFPTGKSCEQAAETGLVDRYFPQAVRGQIPVRWCNGSAETWQADSWLTRD